MRQADVIIIGGGPGGYEGAARLAQTGAKVVLIERDRLGGTCLNRGCIPTKTLLASSHAANEVRRASRFGIQAGEPVVDYAAVHARVEEVTGELRDGVASMLSQVEVIHGEAELTAGGKVKVGGEFFDAPKIVIATGSCPASLRVEGAEYCINSDDFLKMDTLPSSAIIIGGGVIGLEFASILKGLGSDVTVIEYCPEILPGIDSEIAKRLRTYLKRQGIDIITNAAVTAVDADHTVHFTAKGKEKTAQAECVICAVGRRPVVPAGVKEAGIELTERGFIKVNDDFRTSVEHIYAVGDVNGRCMLAHAATAQSMQVLMGIPHPKAMPAVVFTDPEVATVGVFDGETLHAIKRPYGGNGKALASGETDGLVKIVLDSDDRVVGVHIVGPHASDLIAIATPLVEHHHALPEDVIFAHPTLAEILKAD